MDREVAPEPSYVDQHTEKLFREIERSGALPDEVSGLDAATEVLGMLVTRLGAREGRELVAALPPTLQRHVGEYARHGKERPATSDEPTFLYDIAAHLGIDDDAAFRLARAVFAAVRAWLPTKEIEQVETQLSYDLAELWRP